MKLQGIIGFILCISLLVHPVFIKAFETDQYNLPTEPLADIGDEVTEYTETNILEAVAKVNKKIRSIEDCPVIWQNEGCRFSENEQKELAFLRSEDAIAKAVYDELGSGFMPFTKSSTWMEGHKFNEENSRYKTGFKKSIYITAPFNYLTLSSTVRLYGVEFGTDKIAHIFQQGYDYYKIYRKALAGNKTEEEAVQKAVNWGKKTERTYFGTWVSGVYSNADLYSNYAGLKFYLGLTREQKIGDETRAAMMRLENGRWEINESTGPREALLKPFISNHLNEAFNPNKYFNLLKFRSVIRKVVRKNACQQWFERYPDLSQEGLERVTKSMELWYSEDYGFSRSKHFITIANTCFGDEGKGMRDEGTALHFAES